MTSNFQITSSKTNGNLHLKLYGDFDVNSGQELINSLLSDGAGTRDIFIDTNGLKTVAPLAKIIFQMNIRNFEKELNNLFFVGANKYKIAIN